MRSRPQFIIRRLSVSFRLSLRVPALFAAFAAAASAAQVQGILMDQMCSCEKSGYGVFTYDNKFLKCDPAGSRKALAALKASKKEDDLKVEVTGEIQGDTIKVASLKLVE